ncbi:FAD-dependent oxidoreductase [Cohnella sp. GCM10027633]|uniref:FAD-dependent oxidoreductase n=1 Tax=unclassified Cohnella TaxID=2636738 RepID=UPI00362AD671
MRIVIIGAGIAGLATAAALRMRGLNVAVYDKNAGLETRGAALTLWSNGTDALKRLQALEEVQAHAEILFKANMYTSGGKWLESIAIDYGTPTVGIPRNALLRILADKAGASTITWNKKIKSVSGNALVFEDGSTVDADLIIAADGIHSVIRRTFANDSLRYSGYTSWRGISSVSVPSAYAGAMTQYWGNGRRFGFVPLKGGRTYWFATANAREGESRMEGVARMVGSFPDPVGAIFAGQAPSEIIHLDLYDRRPLRGWSYGNALLLGDAAHPMTPSLGLGACTALEDAVVLSDCFAGSKSIEGVLNAFESLRVRRANRIVRLSRRVGMIGQLRHPVWCALRNRMYPLVPNRWKQRVWNDLYGFVTGDDPSLL